jgi:hypothetical protein
MVAHVVVMAIVKKLEQIDAKTEGVLQMAGAVD